MRVLTGVPELDDGLAWASSRVRLSLHRGSLTSPGRAALRSGREAHHAFWSGLGALAVGDTDSARRAVSLLEGLGERDASLPAWPVEAMVALLAARLSLASGNASAARRQAQMIFEGSASVRELSPTERDLWTLALELLADALRYAEADARIEELRALAARIGSGGPRGRRLPLNLIHMHC